MCMEEILDPIEQAIKNMTGKTISQIINRTMYDSEDYGWNVLTFIFTDGTSQSICADMDETIIVPLSEEQLENMKEGM